MQFTLEHVLVSQSLDLVKHDTPQGFFFTVNAQGTFLVLHPGRLQREAKASVRHSMRIDTPSTQPRCLSRHSALFVRVLDSRPPP